MKIGIDIGGSHIAIGVVDDKYSIIERTEKRLMSKEKKNIENSIESYIISNVKELIKKYKITKIGIAAPGTIKGKEIISAGNLGIKNYKLVENLERKIDIPIKIRNDAKCAAIAESKIGILKEYERSIFLTLGTGIGGAVLINGEIFNTGELGHTIIEKDGIKCHCGRKGCFEKYASMKAFKTKLRNTLELDETTSGKDLLDIINKNLKDEKINTVIDEFIEYLSFGISNLINIFKPEIIGIGGSFVYFSDIFLERLKNNIKNNYYISNTTGELLIMPAVLGNDAGIIGSCQ